MRTNTRVKNSMKSISAITVAAVLLISGVFLIFADNMLVEKAEAGNAYSVFSRVHPSDSGVWFAVSNGNMQPTANISMHLWYIGAVEQGIADNRVFWCPDENNPTNVFSNPGAQGYDLVQMDFGSNIGPTPNTGDLSLTKYEVLAADSGDGYNYTCAGFFKVNTAPDNVYYDLTADWPKLMPVNDITLSQAIANQCDLTMPTLQNTSHFNHFAVYRAPATAGSQTGPFVYVGDSAAGSYSDGTVGALPYEYLYKVAPVWDNDLENIGTSPILSVATGAGVLSQTYHCEPGYNLFSFNGTLDGTNDMSSELMDAVNVGIAGAALAGECDQISRWVGGGYNNVWLPTSPGPDDFALAQGDGVWVHVTTPSGFDFTLNVTAWPTAGPQADATEINWNMIGPIVNAVITPAVMSDAGAPRNAKYIVGWDAVAQEYSDPFIKDFDEVPGWDVEPGLGYWVWYLEASTQNYVA